MKREGQESANNVHQHPSGSASTCWDLIPFAASLLSTFYVVLQRVVVGEGRGGLDRSASLSVLPEVPGQSIWRHLSFRKNADVSGIDAPAPPPLG